MGCWGNDIFYLSFFIDDSLVIIDVFLRMNIVST